MGTNASVPRRPQSDAFDKLSQRRLRENAQLRHVLQKQREDVQFYGGIAAAVVLVAGLVVGRLHYSRGQRMDKLKLLVQNLEAKHRMAEADLREVQRRSQREIALSERFAVQKLAKDLLPCLDDVGSALVSSSSSSSSSLAAGFRTLESSLLHVLASHGVEKYEPRKDFDKFDPEIHDAVQTTCVSSSTASSSFPLSASPASSRLLGLPYLYAERAPLSDAAGPRVGRIADVIQVGYMLHDRVLRPARVSVYK